MGANDDVYYTSLPYTGTTCSGATLIWNTAQCTSAQDFVTNQSKYVLVHTSSGGTKTIVGLTPVSTTGDTGFSIVVDYDNTDPLNPICTGYTLTFQDPSGFFSDAQEYDCEIRDKNEVESGISTVTAIESGCDLYDVPYDESIVYTYYIGTGRTPTSSPSIGADVTATRLSNNSNYGLPTGYDGDVYTPNTPADTGGKAYTEFSNGVFYYIPGTQTVGRIFDILKEYRRRKRVGTMFCGGIVNYGYIDNWLSGSLYFFQFKAKVRWDNEEELDLNVARTNYCEDLLYYKVKETNSGEAVKRFYYRSTKSSGLGVFTGQRYTPSVQRLPIPIDGDEQIRLGHPTTMVDLGPRDEFIKEICTDPTLDPNCSVVRSIGPTSFQSFGELLGLVINYRLDTEADTSFSLNEFFDSVGVNKSGYGKKVLDGDVLQLISINNEVGIEEFNLQSPKYLGYSYQTLDPETYPAVFKNGTSIWGPTPITMELDNDGQRVRACINEPGRLTESSQEVPFYLWDKKGPGFGAYNDATKDDQSWDYTTFESQPLQGMTYGYNLTGGTNDPSDPYLLLPITYTFSGLSISGLNVTNAVEFDAVEDGTDNHTSYDTQYPGFTYLWVTTTSGSIPLSNGGIPLTGILYTRYGTAGTWHSLSWDYTMDFIIRKTQDYYSGNKQILSTPFQFYFGLRPGNTGVDKFIKRFGPLGAFPSAE